MSFLLLFSGTDEPGVVYARGARVRGGSASPVVRPATIPGPGDRGRGGHITVVMYRPPPLPPPAVPGVTPARWTFYDPQTDTTGTFRINPGRGAELDYAISPSVEEVYGDGTPLVYYAQRSPTTGKFDGTIFNQADWEFFDRWFSNADLLYLTDDLGRRELILITSYTPARVRRSYVPWYHTFTVEYTIVSATDIPG